jgi:hypothetical protein
LNSADDANGSVTTLDFSLHEQAFSWCSSSYYRNQLDLKFEPHHFGMGRKSNELLSPSSLE